MKPSAARIARRWMTAAQIKWERSSPLDYRVSGVKRIAMYDPSTDPDPSDEYTREVPGPGRLPRLQLSLERERCPHPLTYGKVW